MRFSNAVFLASLFVLPAGMAWGEVQTGDEVTVNPMAADPSQGNTLLYPGGQYMRVVRPLRQPGETTRDGGTLQLHMPVKGAAPRTAVVAPKPAPPRRVAAAPQPKREAAPPKREAAAPANSAGGYNPGFGAFGAPPGSAVGLTLPEPPPKQVAKAEPAPAARPLLTEEPPTPGLTKRSVILFASGASDPAKSALGSIKFLAGDLNASMTGSGSRIQLLAYGGDKGDKGSDARRLSLKRALAIRQVLIDDGVPSERIDVRAMGGADDGGPADRVDVFVKI
ncbi:MAG TPA: OmpA family protein [Rhizomicrobium sp.]|nr:OmpA family protein [Rhizomicrobium sp.]